MIPVSLEEQGLDVYSPLFLITKKTGDLPLVINLRFLNRKIQQERFKRESLPTILMAIQGGDWLASIDLKNAYFHVPVHATFLRFCVRGFHFQFVYLPFGLSTSPRAFSKVLVVVVAGLGTKGIGIFHYLNDILVLAELDQLLRMSIKLKLGSLREFGWLVTW